MDKNLAASGALPATFQRARFTGNAREYFGIWIVNILLTIVTIGIYSAWAKVRRKRYFLGNTVLLGRAFDYHATGKQILIGRIIVVAMILIYNLMLSLVPPVGAVIAIAFALALPWFMMRSLRFNARVTSYLNVRFDFTGNLGGAYLAFLVGPIVSVLTLGLAIPFASRWAVRYVANNMRFGGGEFSSEPRLWPLYRNFLIAASLFFGGIIVVGGLWYVSIGQASGASKLAPLLSLLPFAGLIVFAIAGIFYQIGLRNIAWSAAKFEHVHELKSDVPRFGYFILVFTNLVVTILTLGLMRPWAAVREARYKLEHTAIRLNGPVGEIMAKMEEAGSAVGAEYVDLEGFDFGF